MTTQVFVLFVLGLILAVYLAIAIRTWIRLRGQRVVTCPETRGPAGVTVDVGHAAATAVREKADVRLATCTRWPERADCNQGCVAQIEASPRETRARTMAARYFESRRCVICQRRIGPPTTAMLQPGFMNPVTREAVAWNEVPPQYLPDAIASRRPLCADCTLAESSRGPFPGPVTYRRAPPGSAPPA
jgi:hypothetical protein